MKHQFATCSNENCKRKHECYRYIVKNKDDENIHFDELDCVFFWDLTHPEF